MGRDCTRRKNAVRRGMILAMFLLVGSGLPPLAWAGDELSIDLQEGIRLAMQRNEMLRMAQADLEKAQQRIREARSDALPHLDLSVNYNRNWMLPSITFNEQTVKIGTENNLTGTLSLRQALYSGGKVGGALAAARHFREYSQEVERSVRQQVVLQVEIVYADLLLARELAHVSDLALDRARTNLVQVGALRRAGRVADYDLLRAEVQVASFVSDSIRADNGYQLANMAFKDVIGLDLDREITVSGDFRETTELSLEDLEALQEIGLTRRPEMEQIDRQLQMQERAIQIEKAGSRPSVDLVASGQTQFQSNAFDVADQEWRKSWSSGLVVTMPLFDGMRTGARVAQARVELRRAELEREQLARSIRLEIVQAWLDLREAGERQQVQAAIVGQAEKGLQVAESRYTSGAGTQLEILDGQLALSWARTEWVTARRDWARSLVRLERAVGVLGEGNR